MLADVCFAALQPNHLKIRTTTNDMFTSYHDMFTSCFFLFMWY